MRAFLRENIRSLNGSDIAVKNLYAFAEKGGTVILTNRSGVKNENNNCIMEQFPTVYKKLIGAHIEEYDPIGYNTETIKFSDESKFDCRQWCDILCCDSAEAIAVYDSCFYKNKPAVTRNSYGKGIAYYIGTVSKKAFYQKLIKNILDEGGIPYIDGLPDNVEITIRTGNNVKAVFIFNNTDKIQQFNYCGNELTLAPFEMKIEID